MIPAIADNQRTLVLGRPTIYNQDIVNNAKAYLESCEDEVIQIVTGESEKGFTAYKEKVRVKLPSIEGLAYYLKIHKDTIYAWEREHEDFSDVINILRMKQAERLINNGLSGDYNAYIAKALLAKHGYIDSSEIKHKVERSFLTLDPLTDDSSNPSITENSQP